MEGVMRCDVCHREHDWMRVELTYGEPIAWCSSYCATELHRRFNAYAAHRATRTNDWPTSDEWRRFAAAVADWHMAKWHGGDRAPWLEFIGSKHADFIMGFMCDTRQSATQRLGAEYRRLQEERQR